MQTEFEAVLCSGCEIGCPTLVCLALVAGRHCARNPCRTADTTCSLSNKVAHSNCACMTVAPSDFCWNQHVSVHGHSVTIQHQKITYH